MEMLMFMTQKIIGIREHQIIGIFMNPLMEKLQLIIIMLT